MKILGRSFSKYWLLLVIPGLVVSLPILGFGLIVAGHVAGAILGPPALWNRPLKAPLHDEVAGSYHETERHWEGGASNTRATFHLNPNGTMTLANVPDSNDGETSCLLSGSGVWMLSRDDSSQVDLTINMKDDGMTCKLSGYPYGLVGILSVAGRSKPYKLYWTLGDPDSGYGVWLQRD